MKGVIPFFLRRMRTPLLLLISMYAVAILGLTLIPGVDAEGKPWRMDFFHAFYFISYTATTIGFGEIPFPFTDAQRLWALVSMYLTVIAWFYALGTIIALIQDPAFQHALTHNRFRKSVHRLREPFYLICGYGDTGSLLAQAFTERGRRAVVLDLAQARINELSVTEHPLPVAGLCADASEPEALVAAGLENPYCAGVLAVTNDDQANLQIAITAKLLQPRLRVVCRAEHGETAANMRSFGTDHVVDPFESFSRALDLAFCALPHYWIYQWLTGIPGHGVQRLERELPRGRWLVCGYGRTGRAVHATLREHAVEATLVDIRTLTATHGARAIQGKGTEAHTLREAGVDGAAAVFALTDNDADNLSIVMTARELNPELFLCARQGGRATDRIFAAAELDMILTPSRILASEMLSLLAAPLLAEFMALVRQQSPEWAQALAQRIEAVSGGATPDIWTMAMNPERTPALAEALQEDRRITLGMLERDARNHARRIPAVALLLARAKERVLLPGPEQEIRLGTNC